MPMTAAKISTTAGVLGANRNISTARPRTVYSSDNKDIMRQRPTAQPMPRLPTMLNSPITASDQPPTSGASPHAQSRQASA